MTGSSKFRFQELRTRLLLAVVLVGFLGSLNPALGAEEDDDASFGSVKSAPDKARRRLYPGGRDEEELTVQASLPMPVRSPDAVPGAPGAEEDSGSHD